MGVSWPALHPSPHGCDPGGPLTARPNSRFLPAGMSLPTPWWPRRTGPGWCLRLFPDPFVLGDSWAAPHPGSTGVAHGEQAYRPCGRRVRETAEASAGPRRWAAGVETPRDLPRPDSCPSPPNTHRDHAGPLRLCAAADPHHRAHPGWPPVPQIWRPRLRPRAVRRQLPCPPGPVEATDTPPGGEQSQVTLAPEHRLAINPLGTASGLISAGLPASRLGGGLGLRDGAWNAGGLPGGGACSWVPGFREGNITQVPPAPWSPSPRPMRSTLSASPEHPAPTPQPH